MNPMLQWTLGALVCAVLARRLFVRLRLSRAKHRSAAGHPKITKWLSRRIPAYDLLGEDFYSADAASPDVLERRRRGFERLARNFRAERPTSIAALERLKPQVSDLQFVGRYRVPFPFSRMVRETLDSSVMVSASRDYVLTDLDGNSFVDLTGAYGVNVFGNARYRRWIAEGCAAADALGPVLGPYDPVIERNVERLRSVSNLDEVSFHMSGTEAVMQAVRLARYHTGRTHIVRFAGAYHGWWDDVQPGVGNPAPRSKVYTLAELSRASLRVLETRNDIACVLVNPLQSLHPNANAPGDGSLLIRRSVSPAQRAIYSDWLQRLRKVCTRRGIVLILDEVFTGFRLAPGGAQEYFGIQGDLVTYGKTLGGGLPVGALCGRAVLMKRYREDRPADICFARGTFNSHPYVLHSMDRFLSWYSSDDGQAAYVDLESTWTQRATQLNTALAGGDIPVRVEHLSSIFTTRFETASRYHWMLQFYLNAEHLLLPWVGTGRMILPIDFEASPFEDIIRRFVNAATAMREDGWWDGEHADCPATLRRALVIEMLKKGWARRHLRSA